jgi:hypothetical protein
MKKQLLFMAIAGLFTSMASAADLYVRDLGAGGAYPTISAAITAAVDGDRIIIRPKAANLPYVESLTIDKSLSFVSETNFAKYLVQGTVFIVPTAGRVITINNMNLSSIFSVSAATTGGRTTVNVFNSTLGANVDAAKANTSLNMSGCVVTTGIAMTHGRLTANRCESITASGTTIESSQSADGIEIIANLLVGGGISINEKNYSIRVLNNFCYNYGMAVQGIKTGTTNEIRNNVLNEGTYSALYFDLATGSQATFSVLNNILTTSTTLTNYAEVHNNNTGGATVYAMNNASASAFTTIGTAVATGNIGGLSTLAFSSSTGTVSGSSAIINGGTADDDYADIDLTRNDIGNAGGSDSWSNYWPTTPGNKPQVNYLNTPRRIYTSTTEMNATGSGHSK